MRFFLSSVFTKPLWCWRVLSAFHVCAHPNLIPTCRWQAASFKLYQSFRLLTRYRSGLPPERQRERITCTPSLSGLSSLPCIAQWIRVMKSTRRSKFLLLRLLRGCFCFQSSRIVFPPFSPELPVRIRHCPELRSSAVLSIQMQHRSLKLLLSLWAQGDLAPQGYGLSLLVHWHSSKTKNHLPSTAT